MSKERDFYADFLKGLLIIMVVVGHVIQNFKYESGTSAFWTDILFKYIYTFHMPLFAAVSGYYTCLSLKKVSGFEFIKDRTIHLFIPLAIWVTSFVLIDYLSSNYDPQTSIIEKYYRNLISSYWFIWAILIYSIVMGLLKLLKLNNNYFIGFIGIASMIVPSFINNVTLAFVKDIFIFFVIGYLFTNIDLYKLYSLSKKYIIGLFFISMLCLYVFPTKAFIYFNPSDIYHLDIGLIRLFTGVIMSIVFLTITYFIYVNSEKGKTIDYIIRFGKGTLGIYLIQAVFFYAYYINYNTKGDYSSVYSILYVVPSIFIVIMIYYIIILINKNRYLGFLLLGKKIRNRN